MSELLNTREEHQTLSTFDDPKLFEVPAYVPRPHIESVGEFTYDDEPLSRPLGAGALRLSLFHETELFGYGPMHQ